MRRGTDKGMWSTYYQKNYKTPQICTWESLAHSITHDVIHGYDDVLDRLLRLRFTGEDQNDRIARIKEKFLTPPKHHDTPIFIDDVRDLLPVEGFPRKE